MVPIGSKPFSRSAGVRPRILETRFSAAEIMEVLYGWIVLVRYLAFSFCYVLVGTAG